MAIIKSSDYRFIGIYKNDLPVNWNDFKHAADIDYISFFMQYHLGIIPIGTVGWTMEQMIEKYCKAILSKSNSKKYSEDTLFKKPFGHNIVNLWKEIKHNVVQFSFEKTYDDFVNEINNITTDTRYGNYSMGLNLGLIETFTNLGCEFRFEILGASDFHKSFFGLPTGLFIPRYFLNNYNYEILFKKLMHFSIEHGISFSGAGIPDTYEHTGVKLSKASGKFCQCGIHKNIEANCPMCKKTIWLNNMIENDEPIKLREYFESR